MPLNAANTRVFHRTLYAGQLQTITLLKRNDDQQEGTVTSYLLFDCRRSSISKTGEPIQAGMTSEHRTTWQIPRIELDRQGITHIMPADRFVDMDSPDGFLRYWQPESTTEIRDKLFQNQVFVDCLRIDPDPNMAVSK